jgi:hypothetical protein
MKSIQIADEARRLQYEIWHKRALLFPMGQPPYVAMFDPRVAAHVLELEYQLCERISSVAGHSSFEAAGTLNRVRKVISISTRFKYPVQRFTGAHEIGHYTIHPDLGNTTVHRDLPVFEYGGKRTRPLIEREADYFAACFLAPRKLLTTEFEKRFGPSPLRLDESVAFHLRGALAHELFIAPHGSLNFAVAVAGAQKFDRNHFVSLAEKFGMTVSAMAIRLKEIGLIKE